MDRNFNEKTWVNVREIGIILNVHAFVVYSYLLQIGVRCVKDRYGNGYVNGVDIRERIEEWKKRASPPQRAGFY